MNTINLKLSLLLLILIIIIYLIPTPKVSLSKLYNTNDRLSKRLKEFNAKPIKEIVVNGIIGDITGNIANFKTKFSYTNYSFTDYLTLLKQQNNWKIISKTFTKTIQVNLLSKH